MDPSSKHAEGLRPSLKHCLLNPALFTLCEIDVLLTRRNREFMERYERIGLLDLRDDAQLLLGQKPEV